MMAGKNFRNARPVIVDSLPRVEELGQIIIFEYNYIEKYVLKNEF